MVVFYIIGTFVAVMVISWVSSLMGINIFEGPDASAFYFYGSIIVGILLDINYKLNKNKREQ